MALKLKSAEPAQGLAWVRNAFRVFVRHPVSLTAMLAGFLLITVVMAELLSALLAPLGALSKPLLGVAAVLASLLPLMALPMMSLGFMIATRVVIEGQRPHFGVFVAPFQPQSPARRPLLKLCFLYAVLTAVGLLLCEWIDGGQLDQLMAAVAAHKNDEAQAIAAQPAWFWGAVSRLTWLAALSVPFWHAPALVLWGGQGVGQSLFSSTLACWRNKAAFLVYSLAWFAIVMLYGMASAILFGLLGAPQWIGVAGLGAGLVFSTVFYLSLYFTFADSFADSGTGNGA